MQQGPVQVKDRICPKNNEGRRFSKSHYYIKFKNGEKILKINRSSIVYSEKNDCVMFLLPAIWEE